jgi:membrane-bound ClpP family serine protease
MKYDIVSFWTGIVLIVLGVILLGISLFVVLPLLIWGVILLVLGVVILVTLKNQEYIEPIKTNKKGE